MLGILISKLRTTQLFGFAMLLKILISVIILGTIGPLVFCTNLNDAAYDSAEKLVGKYSRTSPSSRSSLDAMGQGKPTPIEAMDPEFWIASARQTLAKKLAETYNYKKAKNIIFFLGDGMSLTTVTASRIRKGQLKGNLGEEESLSFERFPHTGLAKTYCANAQVPDSACTATAYTSGVKSNIITLGVSAEVEYNNCTKGMMPEYHVSSIAAWAQKAGKSTGFITTTSLTHASPAALYAHTASRLFECDADILKYSQDNDPSTCMDIAQQLINQAPGRNLDLVMGGGMGKFLPETETDSFGKAGERLDGRNLLSSWQEMHPTGALVTDRDQLLQLNVSQHDKLMGIFNSKIMDFHVAADAASKPTLAEMTEVALNFMSRNENGYFLFIEGGLIDYGNHFNIPGITLDETLEMDKAVELALSMTDSSETLVVVSADHGHPLTISGYPGRGNDILGVNQHDLDANGRKYTTLNYAVGPEQYLDEEGKRLDMEQYVGPTLLQFPSGIPNALGNHGGDDVGVYATGPHSHLFRGILQQNTLPLAMAYAACIGDGPTMCDSEAGI